MACVFCRDALFWAWIESLGLGQVGAPQERFNEAGAKAFILSICKVTTRNELDTNKHAGQAFLAGIREPFMAWKDRRNSIVNEQ